MKIKLLNRLMLVGSLIIFPISSHADIFQTTKEKLNSIIPYKKEHLDTLSFSTIYPKKFYQNSNFVWVVTGATIVGAGLFSFYSGGAGAPLAATGVSSVASMIGGGGAGSYMAGLSTVGGWFGGNAILGGSILNGISLGTIGGSTSWGALTIASKTGVLLSVTASTLDGVFYFDNPTTHKIQYSVRVKQPEGLGNKRTRELISAISSIEERINETMLNISDYQQKLFLIKKEINVKEQETIENELRILDKEYQLLVDKKNSLTNDALNSLKEHLNKTNNQEDLIVLSVLAWNNLNIELFSSAVNKIDKASIKEHSFLNYLLALDKLSKNDIIDAINLLGKSIDEAPYAIEPKLLYLNILSNDDFSKNKRLILDSVVKWSDDFDSDKYASNYSLVSLYYRLGTILFINKDYQLAAESYNTAYKYLGLLQKHFSSGENIKYTILIAKANSLYLSGNTKEANDIYKKVLKMDDNYYKEELIKQYIGKE